MSAPAAKAIMPPYTVLRDFLDAAMVSGLIDYALARQGDFKPTNLVKGRVDPSFRISMGLDDLSQFRPLLKTKLLGLVPSLIAQLRVTPFEPAGLELQLAAHGDGAQFKRHTDTQTAIHEDGKPLRMLSGVYYFNAEPKAFSGGALRLYAIGAGDVQHVDIEPLRNSLLVFPSWAPHEVMPVKCPSGKFIDSRFAINCWFHGQKTDPAL